MEELKPRMVTLNPCLMSFGDGEFRNPSAGVRRLIGRMQKFGVKAELEICNIGRIPVGLSPYEEGMIIDPLQTGLEDTSYLRHDELALSNDVLIERLASVWTTLEKSIVTAEYSEIEFALGSPITHG